LCWWVFPYFSPSFEEFPNRPVSWLRGNLPINETLANIQNPDLTFHETLSGSSLDPTVMAYWLVLSDEQMSKK